MPRKSSENPRRTFASLIVNDEERSLVQQAVAICREQMPEFAEMSVNSFLRAAALDYATRILARSPEKPARPEK